MVLYHFKELFQVMSIYICKWWNHIRGKQLTEKGEKLLIYLNDVLNYDKHPYSEEEKEYEIIINQYMTDAHISDRQEAITYMIDQLLRY